MGAVAVVVGIVAVCAIIGITPAEVVHLIKVLFTNTPIGIVVLVPLVCIVVIGAIITGGSK